MPHHHATDLCTFPTTTPAMVKEAIVAALSVKPEWEAMPFNDRAAIFLKVSSHVLCEGAEADRDKFIGSRLDFWKISSQDLCCYHVGTRKERLASRDRFSC